MKKNIFKTALLSLVFFTASLSFFMSETIDKSNINLTQVFSIRTAFGEIPNATRGFIMDYPSWGCRCIEANFECAVSEQCAYSWGNCECN